MLILVAMISLVITASAEKKPYKVTLNVQQTLEWVHKYYGSVILTKNKGVKPESRIVWAESERAAQEEAENKCYMWCNDREYVGEETYQGEECSVYFVRKVTSIEVKSVKVD